MKSHGRKHVHRKHVHLFHQNKNDWLLYGMDCFSQTTSETKFPFNLPGMKSNVNTISFMVG